MITGVGDVEEGFNRCASLNPQLPPRGLHNLVSYSARMDFGWLVVFGFNGPLRQYFSLYRAVSQREGERGEKG